MRIIAVDFDGTLSLAPYPYLGEPNRPVIKELLRRKKEGAKLILWTCRTGDELAAAVAWCRLQGIEFDAVNENLPEVIESFGGEDTRKVVADEYWDDHAVNIGGF